MATVREPYVHPVPILSLRPTQMTVGMREVKEKRKRWREQKSDKKRAELLGKHMIPVVFGPDERYYVVDHHHLARALHDEGVKDILVTVIGDLRMVERDAFWGVMDNKRWVYPYDSKGERRRFKDIPKSVARGRIRYPAGGIANRPRRTRRRTGSAQAGRRIFRPGRIGRHDREILHAGNPDEGLLVARHPGVARHRREPHADAQEGRMTVTIERVPGCDRLIEAFEAQRQELHAGQCAIGELFRRQHRTAEAEAASEFPEKADRAIKAEKLRGKMRDAQNESAHGMKGSVRLQDVEEGAEDSQKARMPQ